MFNFFRYILNNSCTRLDRYQKLIMTLGLARSIQLVLHALLQVKYTPR